MNSLPWASRRFRFLVSSLRFHTLAFIRLSIRLDSTRLNSGNLPFFSLGTFRHSSSPLRLRHLSRHPPLPTCPLSSPHAPVADRPRLTALLTDTCLALPRLVYFFFFFGPPPSHAHALLFLSRSLAPYSFAQGSRQDCGVRCKLLLCRVHTLHPLWYLRGPFKQ
ncbi:hypothetical protein LZ32DRAFT_314348 [Colletotrichum eremochloae]|nr:hypothetical protein LZ32DRAFT_314348 [Colletotrichum eremochloae]